MEGKQRSPGLLSQGLVSSLSAEGHSTLGSVSRRKAVTLDLGVISWKTHKEETSSWEPRCVGRALVAWIEWVRILGIWSFPPNSVQPWRPAWIFQCLARMSWLVSHCTEAAPRGDGMGHGGAIRKQGWLPARPPPPSFLVSLT